jgi:hypothetical protein
VSIQQNNTFFANFFLVEPQPSVIMKSNIIWASGILMKITVMSVVAPLETQSELQANWC